MIRFRLSNCWNVNELESFSNFSRDYFARRFSLMRGRAIWSVKSGSVGNTRLYLVPKCCLFQWIFSLTGRLCSGGVYILTEQTMWFLPPVSCWEVATRILIFWGYCFSLPSFFFFPASPTVPLSFSFASSPLSESLEQARNKRQKSHSISQNVFLQSIIYRQGKRKNYWNKQHFGMR